MSTQQTEQWNDKLDKASRGSIGDFQKVLVQAVEDLDEEDLNGLYVTANDLCWAQWVVKLRKQTKRKRIRTVGSTGRVGG